MRLHSMYDIVLDEPAQAPNLVYRINSISTATYVMCYVVCLRGLYDVTFRTGRVFPVTASIPPHETAKCDDAEEEGGMAQI